MPNWLSSMKQTFEYYIVDPSTWKDSKKIDNVISSSINWDSTAETLGSASISVDEPLGECYIRIYMITIQNGISEKHPLGTFLIQTPSFSFDGKTKSITLDAYTPLIELKENYPPLGYSLTKGMNILDNVSSLIKENARAPIHGSESEHVLNSNFVAGMDETWISFLTSLLSNANHHFRIDELGRVIFAPNQDTRSLQPVWTYNDDNSSILYPSLNIDHDLYGIPNVVEVIYSKGNEYYRGVAVNDDPDSLISTVSRGRKITHRVTNPSVLGNPNKEEIEEYAKQLLREMSSLEYTLTYKHAYCPVRVGDCVRLNYKRAGIYGIKAKVISQSIECVPGCPVTEKVVFTAELWRG